MMPVKVWELLLQVNMEGSVCLVCASLRWQGKSDSFSYVETTNQEVGSPCMLQIHSILRAGISLSATLLHAEL